MPAAATESERQLRYGPFASKWVRSAAATFDDRSDKASGERGWSQFGPLKTM